MSIMIGYEIECCTLVNEAKIRDSFAKMGQQVRAGRAENHYGPYDKWGIAIDGSIHPISADHFKWELISPVMPIDIGLETMEKVFNWLLSVKSYTNSSCGFHVGVSDSDPKLMAKFNKLKLLLLLKEVELLQYFGRTASQWTHALRPQFLNSVRPHIEAGYASKLTLENIEKFLEDKVPRQKEYSANLSKLPNYVEFRIMGGDYLVKFNKCKETILHYADCINGAIYPDHRKEEYQKELHKLVMELCKLYPSLRDSLDKNGDILKHLLERDQARRAMRISKGLFSKKEIFPSLKDKLNNNILHWDYDIDYDNYYK